MITLLRLYPALWPTVFFLLFLPVFVAVSRSPSLNAALRKIEPRLLCVWSLGGLGIFTFCGLAYLRSPVFFDFFESSGVSIASAVYQGGTAYPDVSSPERYCLPYGPVLFLVLGFSQWLFGASVFSSKLPCCLGAILAIGVFWRILGDRGVSAIAAGAIAALAGSSLLALRLTVFWTKSDPLILLVVMVGLWASFRRSRLAPALLGVCIGLGIGLKVTAAVYFLPVLVIARFSGWRLRDFLICGVVLIAVVLAPFVVMPREFPWMNCLAFFRVVGREGFGLGPAINFLRWCVMLAGVVFIADFLIRQSIPPENRRRVWLYRAALAGGLVIAAVPGSTVLTSPHHLMPFIPLTFLSFGGIFDSGQRLEWRYRGTPVCRAAVYSILCGCLLVAVQTACQFVGIRSAIDVQARACKADIQQILARHSQSTILMGTSKGDEVGVPILFRHELVFAGHPIGLDAAVISDYQLGRLGDPDLPRLLAEIRRRNPRPILWLLPRGGEPFTSTNAYDSRLPIYPEQFRRDFSERFEKRETTAFFDIYLPKKTL